LIVVFAGVDFAATFFVVDFLAAVVFVAVAFDVAFLVPAVAPFAASRSSTSTASGAFVRTDLMPTSAAGRES
jgi:hypothetical protein